MGEIRNEHQWHARLGHRYSNDAARRTATLVPPRVSRVPRSSVDGAAARLSQRDVFYVGLLEHGAMGGIVFIESSAFDFSALAQEFSSPLIEWVGFTQEEYSSSYHPVRGIPSHR